MFVKASATATSSARPRGSLPESPGFRQAQVQRKESGTVTVVAWNQRRSGRRVQIEISEAGAHDVDSTARRRSCERRPVGEQEIAIHIATGGYVERTSGIIDHEWAQLNPIPHPDGAAEEHLMTDVECRPAVLLAQIVLIRGISRIRVGVAVCTPVGIVPEQRKVTVDPAVDINDDLVLV